MAKQESSSAVSPESTSPQNTAAKPARSGTERMIVWGGIGLLLIVSVIEVYSHMTFQKAFDSLQTQLEQADSGKTQITRKEVDQILNREPNRSQKVKAFVGEERYDVYDFKGLLKNRVLCVHYGVAGVIETEGVKTVQEPEVIGVSPELPDAML